MCLEKKYQLIHFRFFLIQRVALSVLVFKFLKKSERRPTTRRHTKFVFSLYGLAASRNRDRKQVHITHHTVRKTTQKQPMDSLSSKFPFLPHSVLSETPREITADFLCVCKCLLCLSNYLIHCSA